MGEEADSASEMVLLLFDVVVLCYVSLQPPASAFCQDRYLGLVLTTLTYAIYKTTPSTQGRGCAQD